VVALGTEFGVVLLQRFYEERANGLDPDAAAATAVARTGRAVLVSAATLGIGFLVLALSGLFPGGLPLIADFGLEVVIDLGLAVLAVFLVMLPVAVALERAAPLPVVAAPTTAVGFRPLDEVAAPAPAPPVAVEPPAVVVEPEASPPPASAAPVSPGGRPPAPATDAPPRRLPGVSGRRRVAGEEVQPVIEEPPRAPRLPGLSGRRRGGPSPPAAEPETPAPAPPAPPADRAADVDAEPPAAESGEATPARRRRRRPPPWVRRRGR